MVWTGPEIRGGRRCRVAGCVAELFETADRLAPGRRRASDGTLGDAAHQATSSRHNPLDVAWSADDVVLAGDVTHDPAGGADQHVWTENLRRECAAGRDTRWRMIIFDRSICTEYAQGAYPAWTWRPYSGSNPHTGHAHYEGKNSAVADGRGPIALGGSIVTSPEQQEAAVSWIWEGRPWLAATTQRVQGLVQEIAEEDAQSDRMESLQNQVLGLVTELASRAGSAPTAETLHQARLLEAKALLLGAGYTVTDPAPGE